MSRCNRMPLDPTCLPITACRRFAVVVFTLTVMHAHLGLLSSSAHAQSAPPAVRMTFSDHGADQTNQINKFPVRVASAIQPLTPQESDFAPPVRGQEVQDPNGLQLASPKGDAATAPALPTESTNESPTQQPSIEPTDSPPAMTTEGRQEGSRPADDPVEPPSFELKPRDNDRSDTAETREAEESPSVKTPESSAYQLPRVGNVQTPLSLTPLTNIHQYDSSGLLTTDAAVDSNQIHVDQNSTYSQLIGSTSQTKFKAWQAHDFYHQPLYFEEPNLERNGNKLPAQNIASAARFLGRIPTLPYRIGNQLPQDRVYTYGQPRPGDPTCYETELVSPNGRAAALQTIVTLGVILP